MKGGSRIVPMVFCLLVLTSPAYPDDAWVLWERHTITGGPTTWWRRLDAFGTKRECEAAALRAARLKWRAFRPTASGKPQHIKADLGDIENGKKPDIPIAAQDIIQVGKRIF